MSTYTDLHNNIKETINVDYSKRTTNQQVKLLNEQNEYWGTFKGQMEVEGDSVISGAQLHDVIINNAILCGDIKGGGLDIPIDEITKAIDEISAGYISKDEALEESITANKDSIDALDKKLSDKIDEVQKTATGDTTALEERLSSAFAEASAYLDKRITSEMSAETSARISADAEISKTLTEHHDKIGILLDRCETLNELALSVDENSVERHEDMLQKLAEHDEKNEQRFLAEHIEMLSTVEKDRHYEIYDATDLTASYPYKLNDYAVNVINTTVQGYVLSSATGSIDANVKKNDDGTVTIQFYNNIKPLTPAYYAVQPGQLCENLKSGIAVETGRNNYQIMYKKDDGVVDLTQKDDHYLEIKDRRNDNPIGKIRQVWSTGEHSCQVLSGILDINTSDSTFKIFNKFTSDVISQASPTLSHDNEKITLDTDLSTLSFYTGVRDVKYMDVKDASTNEAFAIITEDDVIREGADVKSVTVTANGQRVVLTEDNGFSAEYKLKDVDMLYTLKLSDDVLANYETHAKYGFNVTEKDLTPESRSQVRILQENIKDIASLTADVEYYVSSTKFTPFDGKSCICRYDSFYNKWHGTIRDDENDDNYVNITIDIDHKLVDIDGIAENITLNGTYEIDLTPHIYNGEDAYHEVNMSTKLDLASGFDKLMEAYEQMFSMYAFRPTSYDKYGNVNYTVTKTDSSNVEVVFPERKFANKASEFMLRLNVKSAAPDAVVTFKDEQCLGKKIVIDNVVIDSNQLSIKCNQQLTYHMLEVEDGMFIVDDIFSMSLSADMHQKIADADEMICGLQKISADHQLSISNALSGIDAINEQLSSTLRYQGMLSVDSSITSFTDMLFERYKDDDTPPNVTRNMPLYPGYFWIVDAADDEYKIEDMKVGKNDRIYINGEGMIVLSAVTSARVDVEDVYDSDTVHEWQLNECSVSLTNALYEASCMLSSDDKYLSSQISSKVSVGAYRDGHYEMSHADLSVVTISDDTYYEMKDEGKLDDTIIYVLSSEYVNAHGKRVIKVATPELDDDAATRGYVDGISATLSADLSTIRVFAESTLSGQLSAVSADVDDLVEISAKINNRLSSVESHYDKTFEKDVPIKHYTSDELPCDVLSIDRLILTDEDAYRSTAAEKKYALALKYGTLVLVERS